MQFQGELRQPFPQVIKEVMSVRLMREADHRVVRISGNDHVPMGMAMSPFVCPQVIDVVQIDVRQ